MVNVDISNIWCSVSLPKLLELEKDVFGAHAALTKDKTGLANCLGWQGLPGRWDYEEVEKIVQRAEEIAQECSHLVVLGAQGACHCSGGVVSLFQHTWGSGRTDRPQMLYVPENLSAWAWQALVRKLEDTEFALLIISPGDLNLQTAVLLRSLRWLMQRLYGAEKAKKRIFAVTELTRGPVCRMAAEEGWTAFDLSRSRSFVYDGLSAAGLLPMAVAGVDVPAFVQGAEEAAGEMEIRSFENPAWLYAASRYLLSQAGRKTELVCTDEPAGRNFLSWWQELFAGAEWQSHETPLILPALWPQSLPTLGRFAGQACRGMFQTVLRLPQPQGPVGVEMDWKNLDNLNILETESLQGLHTRLTDSAMELQTEEELPFVLVELPNLDAPSMGQMVYFLELSGALCQQLWDLPGEQEGQMPAYEARTREALAQPGR